MFKHFESIVSSLIQPRKGKPLLSDIESYEQFDTGSDDTGIAQALNTAFLIAMAGESNPLSGSAKDFLVRIAGLPRWAEIADFYLNGIVQVRREMKEICWQDADFAERLESLAEWLSDQKAIFDDEDSAEKIWSVFFPEAVGIREKRDEYTDALRSRRIVNVTELNNTPITDPCTQILFTSNVLLTIPPASKSQDELALNDRIRERLAGVSDEQQLYFYDHPIQIGVEPERNEVLYGLHELEEAIEFEARRGNIGQDQKVTCLLSVSVTHRSLHDIAKIYLKEELNRSGSLKKIDLYVFTEEDTCRIVEEIIAPAAKHYLQREDSSEALDMFGVDGEYGRHYSFLKAVAAFWSILVKTEIRATFKIDLDQVFPQEELVKETGCSAFEHFKTPLWGAQGLDSSGQPLELGMIAGALVNESDINVSLFTPDVKFPDRNLSADEYIFYSLLPQAMSTEAEMMTRYTIEGIDGRSRCIQRIHVTGGTNGILVESLRRHTPFTPSFIGRAEDQAYILSAQFNPGARLAYVHKDGLIMRHDKEAFAQEAIHSAYAAKLVGDYVRILYFSAYAGTLAGDTAKLKDSIDPFTGCFVSRIPTTVAYLRFALKAASFFSSGKGALGLEFVEIGARRITDALEFIQGKESLLKKQYEKDRLGWKIYYDSLSAIEEGLKNNDTFAQGLKKRAKEIVAQCFM